jgi:dTDP-4-dehydrorhamnose 3,5-epimerase
MLLNNTPIADVYVIEAHPHADERGMFARVFDKDVLLQNGLDADVHLSAVTFNHHAGTLRGMHYQKAPYAETKFVRVTRGSVFDVAVDLRKESPSYLKWHGEVLSAENRKQLYIPKGCAHGYMTLEDNTELTYLLSAPYSPTHSGGVRYDDKAFGIVWPSDVKVIHPRDAGYADFIP